MVQEGINPWGMLNITAFNLIRMDWDDAVIAKMTEKGDATVQKVIRYKTFVYFTTEIIPPGAERVNIKASATQY
ncbi:hypothetical protein [Sporosarcina ureae]|uniref:hypothetical protein n=1 Tax=Sporosarcina ureae TaxID=1571 RepID=UPI0009DC5866|nr:hypothetical protein [Sporosarcina ureae]ARF16055.1 hypothetical protein SporoP17a_01270 [Sporosarcina ureae]